MAKLYMSMYIGTDISTGLGFMIYRQSSFVFMNAGSAVARHSKKQTVVSTSSCQAKYIAIRIACK